MIYLPTPDQVMEFHARILAATGGADGLRSRALLESAVARAQAGFGGEELFPSLADKAAAIGCGLIQNHPFVDGNKRIGVAVLLLVLRINGLTLRFTQAELVELGLSIASGDRDVPVVAAWIRMHTPPI